MTEVRLASPHVRIYVLSALESLSDRSYQEQCWVLGNCPAGVQEDSLDIASHIILDDYSFLDNPLYWVKEAVYDSHEALSVQSVCLLLKIIFSKYGGMESDSFYIELPEWDDVIDASLKAYKIMKNNNEHYLAR